MVTERCKKCRFKSGLDHNIGKLHCAYIIITGERRGCPSGDECTKFEPIIKPEVKRNEKYTRR